MELNPYALVILALMVLFFFSTIYALYWSAKRGHFQNLEAGARSVFTEDEPEGQQTDFFPGTKPPVASFFIKH
jgi:nitrogen fixation-related uncharacterized protein